MSREKYLAIVNCVVALVLYFIWDYLVSFGLGFFDLTEIVSLACKFSLNFCFLFLVLMFYRNDIGKVLSDFKKNYKKELWVGLKAIVVGFVLYGLSSMVLGVIFPEVVDSLMDTGGAFEQVPVLFILCSLLYYPVIEEIIFKRNFKTVLTNKWSFIFLTALLNAFFQVAFSVTSSIGLLNIIPCTIFYMSFSYMYYETNNLAIPVIYRSLYNLIPVIANFVALAFIF